jgi:uncharacterized protein involved in cysteine biosynthesis
MPKSNSIILKIVFVLVLLNSMIAILIPYRPSWLLLLSLVLPFVVMGILALIDEREDKELEGVKK